MESYHLAVFPTATSNISIALFKDVKNAGDLRTRLVTAATTPGPEGDKLKDEIDFAFIDASMIVSRQHILTAIYQALQTSERGALKTPTVHSETLYSLYPTSNIGDAIKKFGISATSTCIFVIRIGSQPASEQEEQSLVDQMADLVDGDMVAVDEVGGMTDWTKVKKMYKLNEVPVPKGGNNGLLESAIISTIATKAVA